MAKEQERKFKLKYLPVCETKYNIEQGYLFIEDKNYLRVRIIDNKHCYLAYKTIVSKNVKNEYEYEIPLKDALELMESTNIKLNKTRYVTKDDYGNQVDIDIFENGLETMEIEYENELLELPYYCGEEITGNKEYSNIYIALQNIKES